MFNTEGSDNEDDLDYAWLSNGNTDPYDVRTKVYDIFLERSSILFSASE